PLCRLLDRPNPWLTPWELWYLTVVYLELTGNCFWYVAPQSVGDTRLSAPGEIWLIPTPWVRIVPDRTQYVKEYQVAAPGTPAEMDFLNSSKMTRDEILAVFRVPPPITGVVENMGLGADIWFGARVMFCEGTIQPKLDLIGQALTRDLAARYGPDVAVSFPDCSPRNLDQRRKDDELDARLGL